MEDRALVVMALLADRGMHLDKDFELVAEVTGQLVERPAVGG